MRGSNSVTYTERIASLKTWADGLIQDPVGALRTTAGVEAIRSADQLIWDLHLDAELLDPVAALAKTKEIATIKRDIGIHVFGLTPSLLTELNEAAK